MFISSLENIEKNTLKILLYYNKMRSVTNELSGLIHEQKSANH